VTDVYVIVEGQAEETFVRDVLLPHLLGLRVRPDPLLTGVRKDRPTHKGGHRNTYSAIRDDILSALKQHGRRGARVSTMLDLYALPDDFPGYTTASSSPDPYRRVESIEAAMADSIADHRFVPYIQLHEFEALLLCDPPKIAEEYFEYEEQVRLLESSLSAFRGPEWVNDHRQTAPSKRLEKHVPAYDKRLGGPRIAQAIGLATLRERCPHFGEWLGKLETLGQQGPA